MLRLLVNGIILLFISLPSVTLANVAITSPLGSKVIYSEKKIGKEFDPDAWGRLSFENNGHVIDLSIKDRYFTTGGSPKLSPSGKYLVVYSVSGGYAEFPDGSRKYTDKAYCSVIDMRNGCFVSDWDGEACGYDWIKNKDILSSSDEPGAEIFDFLSLRPTIKDVNNTFASLHKDEIKDYLRCDAPSKLNINEYQKLSRVNASAKSIVTPSISSYLNGISKTGVIKVKSYLFSEPKKSAQLKSYLIPGDKVKVLNKSVDEQWVNIGYVKASGEPLIAWIRSSDLD